MASALIRAVVVCSLVTAVSAQAQRPRVEVYEATIQQLQEGMGRGMYSSADLVDSYLARIAAFDASGPALNAMIRLNPRARADAEALDRERRAGRVRGPLHGIPIILKDNFDTRDMPTSGGIIALATNQPREDGFVVKRLREAGAVILGKSNLHELAHGITSVSSLGGQTRNPYDIRRCPGGSSGGTGAAIAASFAAVGWGSDTCGSIRIPSAFNSLYGLRPTQGLVSRVGLIPLSHTQDIPGPLARTVTDLAIALDATVGLDSADVASRAVTAPVPRFVESLSASSLRGARIGLFTNYFADTEEEIADSVRAAIRALRALGADVVDIRIAEFDTLIANTAAIPLEMKFDLNDYLAAHPGAPVRSLTEILDRGLFHEALEARYRLRDTMQNRDNEPHKRVLQRQAALRARMSFLLDSLRLDALAYPTMRQRPVLIGESQPGSTCALSAQSGLPAIALPAGFSADGLPIGLELLGPAFTDAKLVSFAYAFEKAGARRRAPASTPPLVSASAPRVSAFDVTARAASGSGVGRFRYDPATSELSYDVRVSGVPADRLLAVVLRRVDAAGAGRVIQRLSGPGVMQNAGRLSLNATDRRALTEGRLVLALFTSDEPQLRGSPLVLPK